MKNKNPYIAGMAICLLVILIYSCRKEFSEADEINPQAEWAKNYFTKSLLPNEGNIVDPGAYIADALQVNRMSKEKANMKIPIWQKAMEGKTPLFDFVEVPLKYTTKVTPMLYINPKNDFTATADNDVLQASFDRLVIFRDKKGKVDQRIVSFVPTKAYLSRHKGDISHNRVNKIDTDFDGVLVYRKWDGDFLYALYMKSGKAVRKVSFNKPKMQVRKTAFAPEQCETVILYEWFQICYYEGDSQVPFFCDPPYKEEVGSYEMCWDGDPCEDPMNAYLIECGGDGAPPEGGGGGPNPDPAPIDWGEFGTFEYTNEIINPGEDESSETITRYVTAFIYKAAPSLWFQTKEKITLIKYLPFMGYWQLQGITHDSMSVVGNQPSGMTINVVDVATVGSLHQTQGTPLEKSANDYVQMNYIFNDKRTKTINGVAVENIKENITGVKTWHAIHCNLPPN
ncbi:MAG: hypothetical protein WC622_15440 [Pedobacter sp.]